jgi:polyketide biosynthesis enoyl-CoA hydratase PksI
MLKRNVFVEKNSQEVATLYVATPENPYLGASSVGWYEDAVLQLRSMPSLKVVLVKGTPSKFCMGASRDALLSDDPSVGLSDYIQYFSDVPRLMLSIPVPTIAVMEGHAVGGGFVLGLWCTHFLICEESMYGANFMALGFTPGMGATTVLEQIFGAAAARSMLFSGEIFTGAKLKQLAPQLSSFIVKKAEIESEAEDLLFTLSNHPQKSLQLLTETLSQRRLRLLEPCAQEEIEMHRKLFHSGNIKSAIAERYL